MVGCIWCLAIRVLSLFLLGRSFFAPIRKRNDVFPRTMQLLPISIEADNELTND